jgi:hypothetical protein
MTASVPYARPAAGLVRMSLTRFILLATSVFLFVGLGSLLAWLYTDRVECLRTFFRGPGAIYLVFLAALAFSLCRLVVRQFSAGEPLRPAWFLLMAAGACQLVGTVCVQILGVYSPLNPLTHGMGAPAATAFNLNRFGLLVGGPLEMVLLAGGLGWMLYLCGRSGMRLEFRPADGFPVAIAGVLTCLQISDLMAGGEVALYDVISTATGPLLILLLAEASLVRNCMSAMGGGMIARCWNSFAAAIFLTALSNLGMWLDGHGLLSAAPATLSCFLCYLAATAYALGPAWQIEAIQHACGEIGVSRFSPLAVLGLLHTGRTR